MNLLTCSAWNILEGFVRSSTVFKFQHPCPTGAAHVLIAAALWFHDVNLKTDVKRVCGNFCCSPSIDSQRVCRLVQLTFKCQTHWLSAAFRNILKGYTGEWNLKQLGVIPKDPQSKSWFVPPQGKITGNINISGKKQKRILNINILAKFKTQRYRLDLNVSWKRLAYLHMWYYY